jgi:HEPN domain-containing protein
VLASTSHAVIAHAIDAEKTSELETLLRYNAKEAFEFLGLISQDTQIDKYTLLTQLHEVSKATVSRGIQKFSHSDPLKRVFDAIFKALTDSSGRPLTKTVEDEPTKKLLATLSQHPCIPIAFTKDASGSLLEPFSKLAVPALTFKEFPFPNDFLHTHASNADIMRELGVLEKPKFTHYALLTRLIFDTLDANGSCDLGPNMTKHIEKAVKLAVADVRQNIQSPVIIDEDEKEVVRMYLFDKEGVLRPSDALVWMDPDSIHLSHRCDALYNSSSEPRRYCLGTIEKFIPDDYEILVSRTSVSKLSRCIKEEYCSSTSNFEEPNEFEQQFVEFIRSRDFAVGIQSVIMHESQASVIDVEIVCEALAHLTVEWVNDIQTSIKAAVGETAWEVIPGSKANVDAFFADFESRPNTIKALAGVIGSQQPEEKSFFAAFSTQLLAFLMTRVKWSRTRRVKVIEDVLSKWHEGGDVALQVLGEYGICVGSKYTRNQPPRAGDMIPMHMHGSISQSLLCVFEEEEMVAVDVEQEHLSTQEESIGTRRYKYAVVCPRHADDKEVGHGNHLSRLYYLQIAHDEYATLSHACLYKIDVQTGGCRPYSLDLVSSDGGADQDSDIKIELEKMSKKGDFKIFKDTLRQMESMDEQAYKKAMRRLWLQWHPDKCNKSYAAEFFRIIRRHGESYFGGKDFSWLHCMQDGDSCTFTAEVTPDQWNTSTEHRPASSSAAFNCFNEMERERKSTAQAEQRANRSHFQRHTSPRVPAAVTSPAKSATPRLCDYSVADVMWLQARYELKAAEVLYDARMWAKVVWQSQQVIEMGVKSLMLRTCGISTEEMKGLGAHDITQLWDRIELNGVNSDDDVIRTQSQVVKKMSTAYISARYPRFPPTNATQGSPFAEYDMSDANECLNAAKYFMTWAATCEYFRVSQRSKRQRADLGDDLDSGSDESVEELDVGAEDCNSFQPAPLPPPPVCVAPKLPSPPPVARRMEEVSDAPDSVSKQRVLWDRQHAYDQKSSGSKETPAFVLSSK